MLIVAVVVDQCGDREHVGDDEARCAKPKAEISQISSQEKSFQDEVVWRPVQMAQFSKELKQADSCVEETAGPGWKVCRRSDRRQR